MLHINKETVKHQPIRRKFDYNIEYMPEPGMLGTEYVGSDRYAVVCLSVDSPKRITIYRLGFDDEQEMMRVLDVDVDLDGVMRIPNKKFEEIKNNVNERDKEKWSMRTNKRSGKHYWKEMNKSYSTTIHWGIATPYRDPNF